ncbi:MAG: hypothetical protein WCO56_03480 [Verrucomicrobiota bacterium]
MIQLRCDCLVFETEAGELLPMSAADLAGKLLAEFPGRVDRELVDNALEAVVYFFRQEQGRDSITVAEFTRVFETVLRGLGVSLVNAGESPAASVADSDLERLASASGEGFELMFFRLLREEMQRQLAIAPALVRFRGLRGCVKQLLGTRRWNNQCQRLQDQIVEFLRDCLKQREGSTDCGLMVT